jgi:hypothetical protein
LALSLTGAGAAQTARLIVDTIDLVASRAPEPALISPLTGRTEAAF